MESGYTTLYASAGQATTINGNNAHTNIAGTHNGNNIHNTIIVIPAGSNEEKSKIMEILTSDDGLYELGHVSPEELPGTILKLTKIEGPPELRNTWLSKDGKTVCEQRQTGIFETPLSKYLKRIIRETMSYIMDNPKLWGNLAETAKFSGVYHEKLREAARKRIKTLYDDLDGKTIFDKDARSTWELMQVISSANHGVLQKLTQEQRNTVDYIKKHMIDTIMDGFERK
jgi:hypothetical protein